MTPRATSILHPVITVSDMDAALAFYCGLLGFKAVRDHVHDPAALAPLLDHPAPDVRAAILRCPDGSELELAEFREPRGAGRAGKRFEDAGHTFVTLVVDDLDALLQRLGEAGYRTHTAPTDYVEPAGTVRVVYLYGPDDTPLTLAQPKP